MRKITCLIVISLLSVFVFVGCNDKKKGVALKINIS